MGGRRCGVGRDINLWCQGINSRYQVPIERMMLGSGDDDSDEYEIDDGVEEGETDAVEIDAVWRLNIFSNVER